MHACRSTLEDPTGISLALVPAAPALLLVSAVPSQAQYEAKVADRPGRGTCEIATRPRTLAALPAGQVLAPLDQSSLVLRDTPHTVVATGHHRAPGMASVIRAFISDEASARAIVDANKVDYVAMCPSTAEPLNYAHGRPDSLAARLVDDRAPDWLVPVPSRGDGWLVWQVRHQR